MATHYDITMGNDIAMDAHCEITMGNEVARDIHCDVIMSNDFAMCIYRGITMPNHIAMNSMSLRDFDKNKYQTVHLPAATLVRGFHLSLR